MSEKLTLEMAANYAAKLRASAGLSENEPIRIKGLLVKLGIFTRYRPLSEGLYGLSLKTSDGHRCFVLVNSNTTRGRQHFTVAHLYYDAPPTPHVCKRNERKPREEQNADLFASCLLMPSQGIFNEIPTEELRSGVSIYTILRLEQLFSVSHEAMVYRLKDLRLIQGDRARELLNLSIRDVAKGNGYDLSLYKSGNENLTLGDFGSNARRLYEKGKISEGHYLELLNLISNGE